MAVFLHLFLCAEFKKLFFLNVSISWHSEYLDEPRSPRKAPTKQLLSVLTTHSQSPLPPCLAVGPTVRPAFCKAVGGPLVLPQHRQPTHCSPSRGELVSAMSPVMLLRKMCEVTGYGRPVYEMHYSHTGSDGFLHFSYKVYIPGTTTTFKGLVMILPEPNASSMLEEAEKAAAQRVLQKVCNNQLAV